ncbi:MAG: hypothetical protein K8R67_00750 [Desulfobacteraceae bacterium]|nr:hypothetical protein [Desulfobacteraceae bacterium]
MEHFIIILLLIVVPTFAYRIAKRKQIEKQNELGPILHPKTCFLCDSNLESILTSRHFKITAVCNKCALNLPKQLKKEYVSAQKNGRKEDMVKLLDIAKTGKVDHVFLEPKQIDYEYKGGHPDFAEFKKMALTDTPEGIVAFDTEQTLLEEQKIFFIIEWDKILSISADSETITKGSKTLSTLGVLSGRSDYLIAGVASRSSKTTNFLNIGYKGLIETVISFEGKDTKEAAAYYISVMTKHTRQQKS